jgi:regulator of sigma E protease
VNVLVAIFGLAFLVLVHEAGHFFSALAVGMNPRRFYIGFPPAIVKVKRKGIEYGIGAIPLGGYVRIPGMHRPSAGDVEYHFGSVLREAPRLFGPVERVKRALAAGDVDGARAQLPELEERVAEAHLSPEARRSAERILRDLEDGLAPDAYWRQRAWKKVAVIFAGPGTNLVFAIVLFAILFMFAGGKATSTVDEVLPGKPAAVIGLRPGDQIIRIDSSPVKAPDIPNAIGSSNGRPIVVYVLRNGQLIRLGPVRPQKMEGVYRLGFRLRGEGLSAPAAVWASIKLTGNVTKAIGESLARIVHGRGRKDISGPVGIVHASSSAAQEGLYSYLVVLGFISLSLALLNLLPLLPLDGGHIAFSIVEGIRGRALSKEVYERVSAVGLALVLLLFFVGLSNDVNGFGGG